MEEQNFKVDSVVRDFRILALNAIGKLVMRKDVQRTWETDSVEQDTREVVANFDFRHIAWLVYDHGIGKFVQEVKEFCAFLVAAQNSARIAACAAIEMLHRVNGTKSPELSMVALSIFKIDVHASPHWAAFKRWVETSVEFGEQIRVRFVKYVNLDTVVTSVSA